MKKIDQIIDGITMYRLVIYVLVTIVAIAGIGSVFGWVNYSPIAIFGSTIFLLGITLATNSLFASVFSAPTNIESVYITALILVLIVSPAKSVNDLIFIGWVGILSMAAKYILAINKKHIFNPAAIAVVLIAIGFGGSASWWVGNAYLAPFVAVGGYLIARKIRRENMAWAFIVTVTLATLFMALVRGNNLFTTLGQLTLHSSIWFFAFVMLTEPLTTPPTKSLRQIYAILTAVLYLPQTHIGSIYSTPELALVLGNIFVYLVSPKQKLILYIKEKIRLAPDIADFIFQPQTKLAYLPGQYMEWTLPHPQADSRGIRRFLTLASSPTEETVRVGVKFNPNGSSFKKALADINEHTPVVATQLSGDFTLPKDPKRKLAFIAGGIGITPFRSMIKYLIDTGENRDIVLFYTDKRRENLVYTDVFEEAGYRLGIKTVYTLTDATAVPPDWTGERGRVNGEMIKKETLDFLERLFYLSGPQAMVSANEEMLKEIGVPGNQIIKDYFPGL